MMVRKPLTKLTLLEHNSQGAPQAKKTTSLANPTTRMSGKNAGSILPRTTDGSPQRRSENRSRDFRLGGKNWRDVTEEQNASQK